jgi:DNA-binding response OmpR family regulator
MMKSSTDCPQNKPIILAVDDSPGVLRAVNFALNKHYKVYTLNEPGKTKELLQRITPDLFVLDYMMPGISGFDLVNIIRSHAGHQATPIVFLTSEDAVETITTALSLGVDDYIVKPINDDILRSKIAHILHPQHEES